MNRIVLIRVKGRLDPILSSVENEVTRDNSQALGNVAFSGLTAGKVLHLEIQKFCV
jgi:hypothetical protein